MADNTIKGAEGIRELAELYAQLTKQIDLATQETKDFLTTTQKIPSEYIKAIEKLRTTQEGYNKKLDEVDKKLTKVNAEYKESKRVINETAKVQAKLTQATGKGAQELAKLRLQLTKTNRETKLNVEASSKLTGAYRKQSIRLNRLRAQFKDVVLVQGAASKAARRLELRVRTLDTRLKKVDAAAGQFGRSVGNYPRQFKGAIASLRSLASAFGLTSAAIIFVQVLRNVSTTIREFDRQLIAVRKTTDLTRPQLRLFGEEVIQLGLSVKGLSIQGLLDSSEVAGQLGIKGRQNILGFAKAVELLKISAKGIGEEAVADFAKFIEVSKDSAENADRLVSVVTDLGNNFATTEKEIISSAVEIQKGTQLYNINAQAVLGLAAATSSLGVQDQAARTSIRKTLGVIQQAIFTGKNLTDVLNLTNLSEKELSQQFDKDASVVLVKFFKGLNAVTKSGGNTSAVLDRMKLSGDRVAPTILSLAEKHEKTAEAVARANTEYDLNEAAVREAELASESLDSVIKELQKSWDAFVLSLESGDGPLGKVIKTLLQFTSVVIDFNNLIVNNNLVLLNREEIIEENFQGTKKFLEISQFGIGVLKNVLKIAEDELTALEAKKNISLGQILAEKELRAEQEGKIKGVKAVIKQIEDEAAALSGNSGATDDNNDSKKKTLVILEGSVAAYKKLIAELESERDRLSLSRKAYEAYNEQIEEAKEKIERLEKAIKAVNELKPISPFDIEIDEDEILKSTKKRQDANAQELLDETRQAQMLRAIRENTLKHAGALSDEQTKIIQEAIDLRLQLEEEFEEAKREFIFTGIDSIFQARVNAVDKEIEENRRLFANLLDNANLTEEQRSHLEAERDAKEEALLQKKQQREKTAFLIQQGLAVAEIAINLARTITAINLAAATIDAVTLGVGGAFYRATNIPIAIGSAAAQTGIVLAQTLAGFKDGGIAPGGMILVNDNGTTNYKEVIRTPKGRVLRPQDPNTPIDVPKGSEIFKNENEFTNQLNKELAFNGILPAFNRFSRTENVSNALTKDDFNIGIKRLQDTINSGDRSEIHIDERGISKFIKRDQARTKMLNNRFIGRGRKL